MTFGYCYLFNLSLGLYHHVASSGLIFHLNSHITSLNLIFHVNHLVLSINTFGRHVFTLHTGYIQLNCISHSIKSLTVALSCFPPVMGRLVLQLLIVYNSSPSIPSILLFCPRDRISGMQRRSSSPRTISVGGRDGVGKLANVTSNLSCLSILFQFRHQCFHGQIIQPLTHILMHIFFILPYQAHIAMHSVQFYHFKLLQLYIFILSAWLHTSYVQLVFVMAWLK